MRLLRRNDQGELTLTEHQDQIPEYAILSHTWGADGDEVTFTDIQQRGGQDKAGYAKIQFCGEQARRDGIEYFWVDTCCINKTNHVELSEAIVSMFRWYRNAKKCYVYLSDVSSRETGSVSSVQNIWEPNLRISRWFTRGWTLQELLAPAVVEFFSVEKDLLGTKQTLMHLIHEVTTLPIAALCGTNPAQFSVDERIRWTTGRCTKRPEDEAYCLFGIFDVSMPPLYGDGREIAFRKLRKEINDHFGGNVATHLGNVNEVRLSGTTRRPALSDEGVVQAGETDRRAQSSQYNPTFESEDKCNKLMKSLAFDRIDFRVNNVEKALLSTCEWLFRHQHFQEWYESDGSGQYSGLLWIKGKPGCGKSTLMKTALEWARRQESQSLDRCIIVPYFFNARAASSLEKSGLGLYRTVVHHLLSSHPALQTLFAERFSFKEPGEVGEHWTVEELQGFLVDAVESGESFGLCVFIDALDEAEHESDVRQMIGFWVQFSDRAVAADSGCRLRICFSSRHYPHIRIGRGRSLVVEEEPDHGQDIETYIRQQLTCLDGPEEDVLRAEILRKSARIFLWVVLVVEILNKLDDRGVSLSDMRARLDAIPAGLNELFKEILTKSDHGIETSILLFQWMLFRMRPLEPRELLVAMEYSRSPDDPGWTLPSRFSVSDPGRLARYILDCSRGLVEVVEDASLQMPMVQFIHESVREFLMKESGLALMVPALAANLAGISHNILRIACLRCIATSHIPSEYTLYRQASGKNRVSMAEFKSNMRLKLPALDYAITYLFNHAEQAQKYGISQQVFLKQEMDGNGIWQSSYLQWWNVIERCSTGIFNPNKSLIYFVTERHHLNLLSVLLGTSSKINVLGRTDVPVRHIALNHGDMETAHTLLDQGAGVNAHNEQWRSALKLALTQGHGQVVRMFLEAGTELNDKELNDALRAAAERGHGEIVQLLIEAGADVNARGIPCGNALQAALVYGRERVVRILIDAGADVNAPGGRDGTALQTALLWSSEKVVQILLNAGADINAEEGEHGSALQLAIRKGYKKVVSMLIEAGAVNQLPTD